LLSIVQQMPEGAWTKVNQNSFSDVWTPMELRSYVGLDPRPPSRIIAAWSGFGWDTTRGDVLFYGGGHANYSGNDVYRWRSSTLQWERASLPSEIQWIPGTAATMPIDGADAGPASAHTYDNNIYLPVADRFLAIGGALYDSGATYIRPNEADPTTYRQTGPYMFDPAKADPNKVGGSTGSHVQRVAPHPEIVGGNMWQNRDLPKFLNGQQMPLFVNGCTAYAEEGGRDVVYLLGTTNGSTLQDLYRYEVVDVNAPSLDRFSKVGIFWGGPAGMTSCAMDPATRLFVRTGSSPTMPFGFWDLTAPGLTNKDRTVVQNASISEFTSWLASQGKSVMGCGIEFDPIRNNFVLWCGDGVIWTLKAPTDNATTGWTMVRQPAPSSPTPLLGSDIQGGVLGKWRYAPGYDVFVAVATTTDGEVWVYKPVGWEDPYEANELPAVTLTSPAPGASVTVGMPLTLSANASDPDGSITKIEFLANSVVIGEATQPPLTALWTPATAGTYAITARATDNSGGVASSAPVQITVTTPANAPPTVSLTQPAAGSIFPLGSQITLNATASDGDGSVSQVQFLANNVAIGLDAQAPYTFAWTPASASSYTLVARALDNGGATTDSTTVQITVQAPPPPNVPPTVNLLSPATATSVQLGMALSLSANASDSDGSISRVEFLANGAVIGQVLAPPYALTWTPPAAGIYALSARATDNAGATTSTTTVQVTVTVAGTGTPVTVTLQRGLNGYSGAADTTLSSFPYQTATNYGTRTDFREYYRGYTNLIRFAVFQSEGGPVPNGATIQSARVEIYKDVYNYTYRLHPLLKPWEELQATWLNARTGSAWASPGASGAGSDYSATPDAQVTVPWDAGWMSFDVTAATQAIAASRPNFGWRLVGVSGYDGSIRYFRSSDYATASFRPKMTVTYVADATPPPPPPPPPPPTLGFGNATAVGTVSDTSITSVKVNGVTTPVTAGQFSFTLPLTTGTSSVTIEATNAGGTTTKTLTITVP
jgi:hypothetical protein